MGTRTNVTDGQTYRQFTVTCVNIWKVRVTRWMAFSKELACDVTESLVNGRSDQGAVGMDGFSPHGA